MRPGDVRVTVEADVDDAALEKATASAREAAVLELYRLGRIGSGAGARLLGIDRAEFIDLAGRHGVTTLQITPEELDAEVAAANR